MACASVPFFALVFDFECVFLAPSFTELLMVYCKIYVNDEPEGKFLYTETIKLSCIMEMFMCSIIISLPQ